jgi:hypothetical protein
MVRAVRTRRNWWTVPMAKRQTRWWTDSRACVPPAPGLLSARLEASFSLATDAIFALATLIPVEKRALS